MLAAAPPIPTSKDLRATLVEDQRPGQHRLLRRVGDADARPALALRQGEPSRKTSCSRRASSGWRPRRPTSSLAADHLHRGRGHQPEGGPGRRAQVRRGHRHGAAVRFRPALSAAREDVLRAGRAAEDQHLLQPRHGPGNGSAWLATKGPILTRLSVDSTWKNATATRGRKLDIYKPATARGGHAVAIVGYTPDRSSCATAGATGWGDGASRTRHSPTRRRRSPRPTGWSRRPE